jgi:tetratricopeptide (TPR) repeat protein
MLLLPLLVSALPDKKIMWAGVLAAMLLVPMAWNRQRVFADEYLLWDDAVRLLHGEDRLGAQRTYYNRGHASAALKHWDVAIADYQKSLSLDASHPQVYMALADAYYGAKRYTEMLPVLDKVIALDNKNARAYYSKGVVLNALNDKTGALRNMQQSCVLGEMTACAIVSMGQSKKN